MASSTNGKHGSSQGSNNNEIFFSCRLCNQVFKGAHELIVHFDLAHMRKDGCDHLLKPSEPTKVSPCTPPPLGSFLSQTSSWKMQESAVKINHLSGFGYGFGSGSGGKAPSLLHSNRNQYAAWPYPLPAPHAKQVQNPKPNIGTFSGSLTPLQSSPLVPKTSHAPEPRMPTPSRSQEANPMLEAGFAAAADDDYLCAKCKLAKQLRQQGSQVEKCDKEDGRGKLDLSLKL